MKAQNIGMGALAIPQNTGSLLSGFNLQGNLEAKKDELAKKRKDRQKKEEQKAYLLKQLRRDTPHPKRLIDQHLAKYATQSAIIEAARYDIHGQSLLYESKERIQEIIDQINTNQFLRFGAKEQYISDALAGLALMAKDKRHKNIEIGYEVKGIKDAGIVVIKASRESIIEAACLQHDTVLAHKLLASLLGSSKEKPNKYCFAKLDWQNGKPKIRWTGGESFYWAQINEDEESGRLKNLKNVERVKITKSITIVINKFAFKEIFKMYEGREKMKDHIGYCKLPQGLRRGLRDEGLDDQRATAAYNLATHLARTQSKRYNLKDIAMIAAPSTLQSDGRFRDKAKAREEIAKIIRVFSNLRGNGALLPECSIGADVLEIIDRSKPGKQSSRRQGKFPSKAKIPVLTGDGCNLGTNERVLLLRP